jgi:pilus assembly protein Flp/PilA
MFTDVKGATAIEYALVASLVSIAAIAAMTQLGTQLNNTFSSVRTQMAKTGS